MSGSHKIDVTLARRLISTQFPQWAHLRVAPVARSGWDNRTFHLGDQMVLRLPSAEHYAAAVEKEQAWLPRLARQLPLPIPKPLAKGEPDDSYPWSWSVYEWLEGDTATRERIDDLERFAVDLAGFLRALQNIDPEGGPPAQLRGGSLGIWDEQARAGIKALQSEFPEELTTKIWEAALHAPLSQQPVWFHGDVAAGNLLVKNGRLSAVIDFGGLGVGDPACDMTVAWTLLAAPSRRAFRDALGCDDAVWARARGWALWKGLIVVANIIETNAVEASSSRYAVSQVIQDFLSD